MKWVFCFAVYAMGYYLLNIYVYFQFSIQCVQWLSICRETDEDWELNVQDAILEKCKGIKGILHIFVDANSKEVQHEQNVKITAVIGCFLFYKGVCR